MLGLVLGIHAVVRFPGAWMAGTSPAMTVDRSWFLYSRNASNEIPKHRGL
jgi:hypothetical protein